MVGTMLAIGIGLAAASTTAQVVGQVKAGHAAKRAGDAEGARLEFNAGVAEQQAHDALQRGALDESGFRTQVRALIGTQRVGFAGQGVKVGSGSALDVQQDARTLGEFDAQQIRRNAAREAWGFEQEAQDYRMGGDAARRGGRAQQTASYFGAASNVLGSGSSLLMAKYGWGSTEKKPIPSRRVSGVTYQAPQLSR